MDIVPNYKLGIWNAWILMLILYAATFVPLMIYNQKSEKRMQGEPKGNELSSVSRITNAITHAIIMPLTLLLSIFLPVMLDTWWFYAGLLVYLIGLILVLSYSISFGTAPLDEPISGGIYTISRNPGYLGFFLAYLGTGIVSASWIFILCAFIWIISWQFGIVEEERILLEKYGETYQQYMDRTPRWFGFSKKGE